MKDNENKKYIKLGITGVAVLAAGLLCFFLLFRLTGIFAGVKTLTAILAPFIYGAVIAYILTPLCNRLRRLLAKLLRRPEGSKAAEGLAILLALVIALVLVWFLVILVFPQVWDSAVTIANAVPGQLAAANAKLHDLLSSQPQLQTWWDEFSDKMTATITSWLKTSLLPTVGTVINGLGSQLAVFFGLMKNLFLGILVSVYFLANRKLFAAQAKLLLNGLFPPRWAAWIEKEVRYADRMFNGFLMGKLLDSAIIGVICFAGVTLMGFPSTVLISVIVGVTNIIPFFGPFIGAIPCALLLLLENPLQCLYFLIFVVVLQQLDGNLIGPRILGNSTGLSSFWVLFAILLFGGLWGIVGMIVGVPLFAVIYDIVSQLTSMGLKKHKQQALLMEYDSTFHPEPPAEDKKKDA